MENNSLNKILLKFLPKKIIRTIIIDIIKTKDLLWNIENASPFKFKFFPLYPKILL